MAGSLDGRARRIRRLEARRTPERPLAPSGTELEARALDAEIRELEREIGAAGVEPGEWGPAEPDAHARLSLDEEIAALEEEVDLWQ